MSAAPEVLDSTAGLVALARAFDYPRADFWDEIEENVPDEWGLPSLPRRAQPEREEDYARAFNIDGMPLYEGFHRGAEGREGILEDVMRFYAFFDLKLSETQRDYPDHLVTELEFLSYLAMREAEAIGDGSDATPYQRAQRDFIVRHLDLWLPSFARRLNLLQEPASMYGPLASSLLRLVRSRSDRLNRQLEGAFS